jgi:hypothetical protein
MTALAFWVDLALALKSCMQVPMDVYSRRLDMTGGKRTIGTAIGGRNMLDPAMGAEKVGGRW